MQLDPGTLRQRIHNATDNDRRRLITALFLRDAALLAFAIAYISLFSALFGTANGYVGVASFCILLSARFVNYGYNAHASLWTLALVFCIMGLNGWLLNQLPVLLSGLLNWVSLLLILRLTTHQPLYGNGGVYVFSYLLVTNMPAPVQSRLGALILAFIFCSLVFWRQHRHQHPTVTAWSLIKLRGHDTVWHWQVRLATGVTIALMIGQAVQVERVMWLGFACMSILLPQTDQLRSRAVLRFSGIVVGSLLFALCVAQLPHAMVAFLAPLAGFALGLTPSYWLASIFNCFGALATAYTLFGLLPATGLRIINNGVGILIAIIVAAGFQWTARRSKQTKVDDRRI